MLSETVLTRVEDWNTVSTSRKRRVSYAGLTRVSIMRVFRGEAVPCVRVWAGHRDSKYRRCSSKTHLHLGAFSHTQACICTGTHMYTHTPHTHHTHIPRTHATFFFIHSSVDGHCGCSHASAAVNNTAVNNEHRYLFKTVFLFLLALYLGVELLDPYLSLNFTMMQ